MRLALTIAVLAFLSACSSLPDLKVGYYLPKSLSIVEINYTIACQNPKGWKHHTLTSIDIKEVVTADKNSLKFIELNKIDGWYSKSDIEIGLKDDGRFSSINSSNSSHVVEYIDKITSVAASVFKSKAAITPHLCEYVVKHPESKYDKDSGIYLLGLMLKGATDFTGQTGKIKLVPVNFTELELNDYGADLGVVSATFTDTNKYSDVHFVNNEVKSGQQKIEFKIPKLVKVEVFVQSARNNIKKSKVIEAPHLSNKSYYIPIPSAPLFGSNGFSVEANESSKVTKIKYSSDNSGSQGISSLEKVLSLRKTDEEKLSEINTEIGLIKARENLAKCKLDTSQC